MKNNILYLGKYHKTGTAYLYDNHKKFKDDKGKIYKGNNVVVLCLPNKQTINVTKDSFVKNKYKDISLMVKLEEITSWPNRIDNLKISTRSGMYKRAWKSHKKNGTKLSITGKSHGNVKAEKDQPGVRFVKK